MVSTTLTTSTAEQHTNSSTICDSSSTSVTSVAGNPNCQRPLQHQQHPHSSTLARNKYYSDFSIVNGVDNNFTNSSPEEDRNSNRKDSNFKRAPYIKSSLQTTKYSGIKQPQQQHQQQLQHHAKRNSTLSDSTADCLNSKHDALETQTPSPALTKLTRYDAIATAAPKPTKTPTTPTANSSNLPKDTTSISPPLADQISLLFPKCRPKHVNNNNNNNSNNNDKSCNINNNNISNTNSLPNSTSGETSDETDKLTKEIENALTDHDDSFTSNEQQITLPTTNRISPVYHRTVNLITQSPPPHNSTSSVSSESLSSVTPRISTNPFLYPNLSADTDTNCDPTVGNKEVVEVVNELGTQKRISVDDVDGLPVPTIENFYYRQTSSIDRREERKQHSSTNCDYDMPRKRFSNYSNYHRPLQTSAEHLQPFPQSSVVSVDVHHQQTHQPLCNGTDEPTKEQPRESNRNNQNPFIKNNVWETGQNNESNSFGSNEYQNQLEKDLHVPHSSSSRRSYHSQTYYNNTNPSTSRHQHYIRVSHSPIQFGDPFDVSRRTSDRVSNKCNSEQYIDVTPEWNQQDHHPLREGNESKRDRVAPSIAKEQEQNRQSDRLPNESDVRSQSHVQENASRETERRPRLISGGDVVVFDDIAESWQNLRVTTETNPSASKRSSSNFTFTAATEAIRQKHTFQDVLSRNTEGTMSPKEGKFEPTNNGSHLDDVLHKDHKRNCAGNYAFSGMETRHGIIEYEGSPRRIGQGGGGLPPDDESTLPAVQSSDRTASISLTSNSPQQHYRARPGFPQRILSPPCNLSPPLALLSSRKEEQHPQQLHPQVHEEEQKQQQQQQQQQQQPFAATNDNNAEDTSNDVSEIGTISDLTTPEITSAVPPPNASVDSAMTVTTTPITPSTTVNITNYYNSNTNNNYNNTTATAFSLPAKSSTFDYLYEFSETRKVLEEFFKCPSTDERPIENGSDVDSVDIQYEFHTNLERDDVKVRGVEEEVDATDQDDDDDGVDEVDDDEEEGEEEEEEEQEVEVARDERTQQKKQFQLKTTNNKRQPRRKYLHQQRHNHTNHQRRHFTNSPLIRDFDFFLESASRSSGEQIDQDGLNHNQLEIKKSYRYSPETTDYDSNCDLDSLSGEMNGGISTSCSNYTKYYTSSMPVLEDGLSSGHTSDTENNNLQQETTIQHNPVGGGISLVMDTKCISISNSLSGANTSTTTIAESVTTTLETDGIKNIEFTRMNSVSGSAGHDMHIRRGESPINSLPDGGSGVIVAPSKADANEPDDNEREHSEQGPDTDSKVFKNIDPDLDSLYSISVFPRPDVAQMTPPPPAPAPHRKPNNDTEILQPIPFKGNSHPTTNTSLSGHSITTTSVASITGSNFQRTKSSQSVNNLPPVSTRSIHSRQSPPPIPERSGLVTDIQSSEMNSPVWVPRQLDASSRKILLEPSELLAKSLSADEEEVDTDLETDRLLGHQRLDDQGYYDENKSWERKSRSLLTKFSPKQQHTKTRNGYNALLSTTPEIAPPVPPKNCTKKLLDIDGSMSSPEHSAEKTPEKLSLEGRECESHVVTTIDSPVGSAASVCGSMKNDSGHTNNNNNTNQNGGASTSSSAGSNTANGEKKVKKSKNKEGGAVLIEGVLFRARYLGSTQLVCEGQPTKSTRMMQAEEAVSRIKALAPDGDVQPSTEVDLFISTEKIMVLNTDLKEIMMDHALRTISYIADIGDLVVLMARRRFVPQDIDDAPKPNRTPKMICHVFESDEAQFIAQSIGQAFQVAYMEFLKANGIEDHSFVKEMDYQEVLNSQEIFGDELEIFAKKELQKEVVVPKAKGEILGVVIVESGWGSMLPTVVIANLMSTGAAARCGQLNIGDQLIAINGLSLVGLPLSTCQTYIKNTKNQTVVKFTVVPCAPVVEVKIKRPNTKYQLGFSVQNGVICSLLRGGIAERGGVRVGHRIIEINNQSVVAVPHEKIVNLLATSVGEILMKTMPTSMFRLLTGQENPIYI